MYNGTVAPISFFDRCIHTYLPWPLPVSWLAFESSSRVRLVKAPFITDNDLLYIPLVCISMHSYSLIRLAVWREMDVEHDSRREWICNGRFNLSASETGKARLKRWKSLSKYVNRAERRWNTRQLEPQDSRELQDGEQCMSSDICEYLSTVLPQSYHKVVILGHGIRQSLPGLSVSGNIVSWTIISNAEARWRRAGQMCNEWVVPEAMRDMIRSDQ